MTHDGWNLSLSRTAAQIAGSTDSTDSPPGRFLILLLLPTLPTHSWAIHSDLFGILRPYHLTSISSYIPCSFVQLSLPKFFLVVVEELPLPPFGTPLGSAQFSPAGTGIHSIPIASQIMDRLPKGEGFFLLLTQSILCPFPLLVHVLMVSQPKPKLHKLQFRISKPTWFQSFPWTS